MKVKITMKDNEARRFLGAGSLQVPPATGAGADAAPRKGMPRRFGAGKQNSAFQRIAARSKNGQRS